MAREAAAATRVSRAERCLHGFFVCVQLLRVRGELLSICLVCGDLEGAIEQCRAIIAVQRKVPCCWLCAAPSRSVAVSHTAPVCVASTQIYHPCHPLLGLQLYTLGDLLRNSHQLATADGATASEAALLRADAAAAAVPPLREAHAILEITHGAASEFVTSLATLLQETVVTATAATAAVGATAATFATAAVGATATATATAATAAATTATTTPAPAAEAVS